MKHVQCVNYINLDCEKGMCAIDKVMVPMDGEGSDACPRFTDGFLCKFCKNFANADEHSIGTCSGFEKKDWAYADCGAFTCEKFIRQ